MAAQGQESPEIHQPKVRTHPCKEEREELSSILAAVRKAAAKD